MLTTHTLACGPHAVTVTTAPGAGAVDHDALLDALSGWLAEFCAPRADPVHLPPAPAVLHTSAGWFHDCRTPGERAADALAGAPALGPQGAAPLPDAPGVYTVARAGDGALADFLADLLGATPSPQAPHAPNAPHDHDRFRGVIVGRDTAPAAPPAAAGVGLAREVLPIAGSSAVLLAAYDPAARVLTIVYASGGRYDYLDRTAATWRALRTAYAAGESVGRWVRDHLRTDDAGALRPYRRGAA